MRTILLDENNDIDLTSGSIQFLTGIEGLRQRHETRLKVFRGEWYFNESLGIPYIGNVLGIKSFRVSDMKAIFVEELMKVPETSLITEMFFDDGDIGERKLSMRYSATMTDTTETLQNEVEL